MMPTRYGQKKTKKVTSSFDNRFVSHLFRSRTVASVSEAGTEKMITSVDRRKRSSKPIITQLVNISLPGNHCSIVSRNPERGCLPQMGNPFPHHLTQCTPVLQSPFHARMGPQNAYSSTDLSGCCHCTVKVTELSHGRTFLRKCNFTHCLLVYTCMNTCRKPPIFP